MPNESDNCPLDPNPLQEDADGNGVGDACEVNASDEIIPPGTDIDDSLGYAISISGDVGAISAPGDDDLADDAGAVYVYRYDGTNWIEEQKLLASDGAAGDRFGRSVSVDANVILVGTELAEAAYVFRCNGSTWVEEAKLEEPARAAGNAFGWAVAVDGDWALVGSYADQDDGSGSGSAFLFQYSAGTGAWTFSTELIPLDLLPGDNFGWALDLAGDLAVVGAPGRDDWGADSGAAYAFRYDGSAWTEEAKLLSGSGAAGDEFGFSIAIDNSTVLVGAPGDDGLGTDAGAAYIFNGLARAWSLDQKIYASDTSAGDGFGSALDVGGTVLVIGSLSDDNGLDAGSAYAFVQSGGNWQEQAKLLPASGAAGDGFGSAIAVSPPHVMVGASAADTQGSDSGTAYVYAVASIEAEPPVAQAVPVSKNRYISFRPRNQATAVALQVEHFGSGMVGWVDTPDANGIARLVETPVFRQWAEPEVHVGDCEIAPVSSYEVRATVDGTTFTAPVIVATIAQPGTRFWGDIVGGFVSGAWTPPDGNVNGFDIVAVLKKFQLDPAAPHISWVDLSPVVPDKLANGQDILQAVNSFSQAPYPFVQPANCP